MSEIKITVNVNTTDVGLEEDTDMYLVQDAQ